MTVQDGVVHALEAYSSSPQTAKAVADFAGTYFGGVGHNLVGLLGGDWVFHARLENMAKLAHGVRRRLHERGIDQPAQVSVALGLPLLKAAADENQEELTELWERLIASAMDPKTVKSVRKSFISLLSSFDPSDAIVFRTILTAKFSINDNWLQVVMEKAHLSDDEVMVSMEHLTDGRLVTMGTYYPAPTHLGREFAKALEL